VEEGSDDEDKGVRPLMKVPPSLSVPCAANLSPVLSLSRASSLAEERLRPEEPKG